MRKLSLSLALLVGSAGALAAQKPMPWNTEIGIRSSFAVTSIDETNISQIQFPSNGGVSGLGGGAALYAVFPVGARVAIEPGLGYSDASLPGIGNVVTMNAGARVLFSAWRGLYVGAGPIVSLLKADGEEDARFGANVAAGYRFPVGGLVTARAEVFYQTVGEGELLVTESSSDIGLAIGLGMGLGAPASSRAASDRMWDLALGFQGGYTHVSAPGAGDLSSFNFPGGGSALTLFGSPVPSVSPWFVVIPVGQRFAVEPSFSYSSFSVENDAGSGTSYSLGVKGNYAFNKTVYAGLSAEYSGMGGDSFDGVDGTTGVGVQTGLRFPLIGGIQGRVEANYRTFMGGENSILGDFQAFGTTFGITAPLK